MKHYSLRNRLDEAIEYLTEECISLSKIWLDSLPPRQGLCGLFQKVGVQNYTDFTLAKNLRLEKEAMDWVSAYFHPKMIKHFTFPIMFSWKVILMHSTLKLSHVLESYYCGIITKEQ